MSECSAQKPSLTRLRRNARDIVRRFEANDLTVLDLLRSYHPSFTKLSNDEIFSRPFRLSDAQLVLARQQGEMSWSSVCSKSRLSPPQNFNVDASKVNLPEYRHGLAALRGLPAVGTAMTSSHGVKYEIKDYAFAPLPCNFLTNDYGYTLPSIANLLPLIFFGNTTYRLLDLYKEVDSCTSKHLLFFDTMPDQFPGDAVPGLNMVQTTNEPNVIRFLLDARETHETIIAHELGHLWIEFVDDCEDFRYFLSAENAAQRFLFTHLQSFVLDLKVNDLLEERGFDMSILVEDQVETSREITGNCVLGKRPLTKEASVATAIGMALAILEQRRWRKSDIPVLDLCVQTLRAIHPEIHELMDGFVKSVKNHGYSDRESIRRVVDDCSVAAFRFVGTEFSPSQDLMSMPPTEWMFDKRPEFLPGIPVTTKLAIRKAAAKAGLGTELRFHLRLTHSGLLNVKLSSLVVGSDKALEVNVQIPMAEVDTSKLNKIAEPPSTPVSVGLEHHLAWKKKSQQTLPKCSLMDVPALGESRYGVQQLNNVAMSNPVSTPFPPGYMMQPWITGGKTYVGGLGRFLSRVGWGYPADGESNYGYCFNNPVSYVDPDGRRPTNTSPVKSKKSAAGPKVIVSGRQSFVQGADGSLFAFNFEAQLDADGVDAMSLPGIVKQIKQFGHTFTQASTSANSTITSADTTPYLVYLVPSIARNHKLKTFGVTKYDVGIIINMDTGTAVIAQFLDAGHSIGGEFSLDAHKLLGNTPTGVYFNTLPSGKIVVLAFPGSANRFDIKRVLSPDEDLQIANDYPDEMTILSVLGISIVDVPASGFKWWQDTPTKRLMAAKHTITKPPGLRTTLPKKHT